MDDYLDSGDRLLQGTDSDVELGKTRQVARDQLVVRPLHSNVIGVGECVESVHRVAVGCQRLDRVRSQEPGRLSQGFASLRYRERSSLLSRPRV